MISCYGSPTEVEVEVDVYPPYETNENNNDNEETNETIIIGKELKMLSSFPSPISGTANKYLYGLTLGTLAGKVGSIIIPKMLNSINQYIVPDGTMYRFIGYEGLRIGIKQDHVTGTVTITQECSDIFNLFPIDLVLCQLDENRTIIKEAMHIETYMSYGTGSYTISSNPNLPLYLIIMRFHTGNWENLGWVSGRTVIMLTQ